MGPILRAHGLIRTIACLTCISSRLRIILQRVIAIHQMIFVEFTALSTCPTRQQEVEIPPRLLLDHTRRVPRMIERQPRRHHHHPARISAEIFNVLMNAPHEANVRYMSEDALYLRIRPKQCTGVHIDIDKMHNEPIKFIAAIVLLDQWAHARCALLGKVLICVGEYHPVSCRCVEGEILCSRKVVDPIKIQHPCTTRTGNRHSLIR